MTFYPSSTKCWIKLFSSVERSISQSCKESRGMGRKKERKSRGVGWSSDYSV